MEGEVFALFPEVAGTNDPFTCMAYAIVGEHHSANLRHCILNSTLATPKECVNIINILTRRGYDLENCTRVPSYLKTYEIRLKQINGNQS